MNQAVLIENAYIVNWRKNYIQTIKEYKLQGRPIFYLDESWVNSNHRPKRILTNLSIKSHKDAENRGLTTGIKRKAGRGPRVILMGMGSKDGWVAGSPQVWMHKTKGNKTISQDYH